MLFNKLAALAILPLLAAATPRPQGSECKNGTLQCCQSVQSADSPAVSTLLGLLGVVLKDPTGTDAVGITCTPISVIGVAGTSCTAQPVCCSNDSFNGLIALGCTPVNV
ncbi:fungal hydrophobin [Schizopora paradoxa]|uniref:Hydrophobin n=1 Tax=Schizopora paradoxa TaxID=27342 RepID=A0A0H2RRF0_9AGAM|nr:fungal hydrophobin [Schizopora paradoxa]